MREIIFDTETTGLDPRSGDRLVEIGCIEMVNRVVTGQTFHAYFNPDRDMPAGSKMCCCTKSANDIPEARATMVPSRL